MKQTDLSTYQAGNLQSKAYRSLKALMAKLLEPHGLTMIQWAALGTIHESGSDGMRITDLARELSTSLAFTTTTVDSLVHQGLVERVNHQGDKRTRYIRLLPRAEEIITGYEAQIRSQMRDQLYAKAEITPSELETYLTVLAKLANISRF